MSTIDVWINKLFAFVGGLGRHKDACSKVFAEAASMLTYVETICPDKADSIHRKIKFLYDEDLESSFDFLVRKSLAKLKVKNVEIAIDCKRDNYWGKKSHNVIAGENDRGTNKAFEWNVMSITKPHPMPLMVLPLHSSAERAEKTIQLINYAIRLQLKVKRLTLDRGFYNHRLIDFMQKRNFPFLMLVPATKPLVKYAKTAGIFSSFIHVMNTRYQEKIRVKIVVIKEGKDVFFYATNLKSSMKLHLDYKKRWQIETDFRVIGEAKIKSKSNFHIIRYFYFMLRLVMLLIWNVSKRIIRKVILFKRFLIKIVRLEFLPNWIT